MNHSKRERFASGTIAVGDSEEDTITSQDERPNQDAPHPTTQAQRRHSRGAPLWPPAVAYVTLALLAVIVPTAVAGETPYASDAHLLHFFAHHQGAAHLSAFLTLASAVPFAAFAAILSHRVRTAGIDVPGRVIALVGGSAAAVMLAMSGLATLTLTGEYVADDPSVVRVLYGLAFATGGPGFVVFSGLLLAGISVPMLVGRLAPRWVGWLGLGVAVACELATLTAATSDVNLLLPIGRFGSMLWMLAAAATLNGSTHREAE